LSNLRGIFLGDIQILLIKFFSIPLWILWLNFTIWIRETIKSKWLKGEYFNSKGRIIIHILVTVLGAILGTATIFYL